MTSFRIRWRHFLHFHFLHFFFFLSPTVFSFLFFFPTVFFLHSSLSLSGATTDPVDQAALVAFWEGITNPEVLGWNTASGLCGQSGVTCTAAGKVNILWEIWMRCTWIHLDLASRAVGNCFLSACGEPLPPRLGCSHPCPGCKWVSFPSLVKKSVDFFFLLVVAG